MTANERAEKHFIPQDHPVESPTSTQNLDSSCRKAAERDSLEGIEEEFQAILDSPMVGVGITSPEKHWVRVNEKSSQMIGYSREELETIDWVKLTHPDDLASDLAQFSRLFSGEIDHYTLEKRFIRKDGSTLCAGISVNAIRRGDASLKYAVGLAVEATQGELAKRSLVDMRRQLIEAQEQERARIGRDLHDDILQRLALFAVEIRSMDAEIPANLHIRLQALRAQVDEIANEVRALSNDLHASNLDYLGGISGIKSWCIDFAKRQNMQVAFRSDVQTPLPRPIGIALFRITQEALHNTLKHSGTDRVRVNFVECSNKIILLIQDAGRGFKTEHVDRGLGLVSMRERAQLIGGSLSIDSEPQRGTSIQVKVPLP